MPLSPGLVFCRSNRKLIPSDYNKTIKIRKLTGIRHFLSLASHSTNPKNTIHNQILYISLVAFKEEQFPSHLLTFAALNI